MSQNAVEIIKRAFSGFGAVTKRDPKGDVVEIDLAKVATDLAKAGAEFGVVGDVTALEKAVDELGSFIEKLEVDPSDANMVFTAQSEIAKRFEVEKDADGTTPPFKAPPEQPGESYTVAPNGAGRAKKPTPAEAKQIQYTAGSGLANDASPKDQYTASSSATVGTVPGGKAATSFDQPAGGPTAKAIGKVAKAQQPAHPETLGAPGMLLEENQAEGDDPLVSSGTAMRRAKKRIQKSTVVTTEELWARDMADMTTEEVTKIRKAAGQGALDGDSDEDGDDEVEPRGEPDDRSSADAKRKAKAKKVAAKKAAAAPEASVDELEDDDRDADAAAAVKPNAQESAAGSVDEVTAKKKAAKAAAAKKKDVAAAQDVDEVDDEDEVDDPAKKTSKKGKPFAGAAKPFGGGDDDGDDDEDDEKPAKKKTSKAKDEEDEDEEESEDDDDASDEKPSKTKKSADAEDDDVWARDMAPAREHMLRKSQRMTESEVPLSARPGTLQTADRVSKIRKSALAGLSPDQVAYLEKSARIPAHKKQQKRAKLLKGAGYVQGSREHPDIEGSVESVPE